MKKAGMGDEFPQGLEHGVGKFVNEAPTLN